MSTAYPPRLVRYMFSSKKERNAARTSTFTPGDYGNFSFPLGLYYVGPGQDFLSEHFVISAVNMQDPASVKQDLHAITFHKGPGILQMTLYSTPDHSGKPIAVARNDRRYGSSTDITLPGPEGESERTERLQYGAIGSSSYTMNINGEPHRWRRDKAKSPKIMRLVKKGVVPADPADEGETSESNDKLALTSQEDVVASWIEGSVPNRDGRIALFHPAKSDTMENIGEYGTLLAISAALVILQRGAAVEGTMAWYEERKLEKRNYV